MKELLELRSASWAVCQVQIVLMLRVLRNLVLPVTFAQLLNTTSAGAGYDLPPDLSRMPVSIWFSAPGITNQTFGFTNQIPRGSGVYLARSNTLYLVTAKHVILDITSTNLPLLSTNAILYSPASDQAQSRFCIFNLDLVELRNGGFIKPHPTRDILVLQLANGKCNRGVSLSTPSDSLVWFNVDTQVQPASKVLIGDDTLMFGYPAELMNAPSTEVDFELPLVRRGTISQKNPRTGKFILDSSVFGGNSGGPLLVILGNRKSPFIITESISYKIAGIITAFVPAATRVFADVGVTNSILAYSGYSVAEPIDGAIELIGEFKH